LTDDPEILASPEAPSELQPLPAPLRPRRIPNFGHTVLFFTVAIIVLLLTSVSVFALAMGLHLLGTETPEQLLREPRLLIPSMAASYLVAGAIVWAILLTCGNNRSPRPCIGTLLRYAVAGSRSWWAALC